MERPQWNDPTGTQLASTSMSTYGVSLPFEPAERHYEAPGGDRRVHTMIGWKSLAGWFIAVFLRSQRLRAFWEVCAERLIGTQDERAYQTSSVHVQVFRSVAYSGVPGKASRPWAQRAQELIASIVSSSSSLPGQRQIEHNV